MKKEISLLLKRKSGLCSYYNLETEQVGFLSESSCAADIKEEEYFLLLRFNSDKVKGKSANVGELVRHTEKIGMDIEVLVKRRDEALTNGSKSSLHNGESLQ